MLSLTNTAIDFSQEVECTYEGELYSVRDNGAVLKHSQVGKRPRPTDNQWTFGKLNIKKGYLEIASVRVHRIVATAFHGEPSTKEHVVDHIDTNKQNNRPENLRWLTRLENVLNNPITVKRIEIVCGCSIEEFLADPSKLRHKFNKDPNYEWMCTVSKEDAQLGYERMLKWANSDEKPTGNGSLGKWIYNPNPKLSSTVNKTLIEQVFKKVKEVTGLSQEEIASKNKTREYVAARVYAATQLYKEMRLSEEDIGTLIGISKSMVNTYLNYPENYLQNADYFQTWKRSW